MLAGLAVLPAIVVITYDQATDRRVIRERTIEQNLAVTRFAAAQEASLFSGAARLLETLAQIPTLKAPGMPGCDALLASVLAGHSGYANIGIIDAGAQVVCSARPELVGLSVAHRPWFEHAVRARSTVVGEYQLGIARGTPSISVARPLLVSGDRVERVIATALTLGPFERTAAAIQLPGGGTLTLFDRSLTILARYPDDSRWIGRRMPALPRPLPSGRGAYDSFEGAGADGVRRLYVTVPVDAGFDTGLYVTAGTDPSAMFANADRARRQQFALVTFVALAAVAVALVGGRRFVRDPITALTTTTRRIAEGDLAARAELVSGAPGFRELADAVNAMATALERRERDRRAFEIERARFEKQLDEAQERFRFALEASHVGVWEMDLRNNTASWSETCEVLHGLPPGGFGGTFDAFLACVHPDERAAIQERIARAIAEKQQADLVYRTVWPDGTERHISSIGRFFYDQHGNAMRGAGVAVDATERRSLEEQFRQAQKMEAVGQLAGGIAHDFNNMLTAIMGNAEFALEDLPEGDHRRADIEEIQHAARRAADLTHQLLAFSRKQILAPRVVHLGDIVGEVTPMLRRLIGESIELRTVAGDRQRIHADSGQISQVIVNLAVNARDAMPNGGSLTIETSDVSLGAGDVRDRPTMRAGGYVKLAVSDSGHGIDPATQARIFEPFFTTKPKGQGTGLGLATVYGIVKQSGGHIWVESQVGRGTTFVIYLPTTSDPECATSVAAVSRRPLTGDETILVIEDEDVVREFVHKILTRAGYRTHTTSGPGQALAFAAAHHGAINIVLTDVVMPEASGPQTYRDLRVLHPEAKVLYMSGYTDNAIADHGILESGLPFLQKPFAGDLLLTRLRDVLGGGPS